MVATGKSQEKRMGRLTTPLGTDVLFAARLDATEEISRPFEFRVEAISEDKDISFNDLLGRNVTMSIETQGYDPRHFDGIVIEGERAGLRQTDQVYRMVLRPWFWLLSYRRNSRIFHNKTAPDIIKQIFGDYGLADFEMRLTKSYPSLEYTVQYRESDFAFCCRMMEKHGIGYFFVHSIGQHKMILSDSLSSYDTIIGDERPFIPKTQREHVDVEHLSSMVHRRHFTTGKVTLNDYDFKKPSADLRSDAENSGPYDFGWLEVYDHPGKYVETSDGRAYAKAQMSAEAARDQRRFVAGDLPSAFPGALITVTGDNKGGENGEYLFLSAKHKFASQAYRTGSLETEAYSGSYEVLPSDIDYAPEMTTAKTRVQGPQTAFVVGEGEIDVDEYGRILVDFHWDVNKDKSRRVRVAQNWASKSWGGMVIPRIGMEVIVEFLEGDPDEPIVTGCVYHAKNMPANTLPDYKTRSDFKTDTHKGEGYNQLRFEDENGQQEIFIQAEKYLNGLVKNDETWLVNGNHHSRIDKSASQSIGGDKDMEVTGEHREHVGKSHHLKVDDSKYVGIGSDLQIKTGEKQHFDAGTSHYIKAGDTIVVEAGAAICLKVGGNFISIDPSGIKIVGTMVMINSGGAALPGSPVIGKGGSVPKKYAGPHAKRYDRSFKS